MQTQTQTTVVINQATRQDVQPGQTAQQQPVELDLAQLQAVSGGAAENSSPVKGW